MKQVLEFAELEEVYELIARAIDAVGRDNEALFLSKLSINLAHRLGDLEGIRDALQSALTGLGSVPAAMPAPS